MKLWQVAATLTFMCGDLALLFAQSNRPICNTLKRTEIVHAVYCKLPRRIYLYHYCNKLKSIFHSYPWPKSSLIFIHEIMLKVVVVAQNALLEWLILASMVVTWWIVAFWPSKTIFYPWVSCLQSYITAIIFSSHVLLSCSQSLDKVSLGSLQLSVYGN